MLSFFPRDILAWVRSWTKFSQFLRVFSPTLNIIPDLGHFGNKACQNLNKRVGYNEDVMRQFACLVVNPVTVNSFAVLFNCMPVGRGSDSLITLT